MRNVSIHQWPLPTLGSGRSEIVICRFRPFQSLCPLPIFVSELSLPFCGGHGRSCYTYLPTLHCRPGTLPVKNPLPDEVVA